MTRKKRKKYILTVKSTGDKVSFDEVGPDVGMCWSINVGIAAALKHGWQVDPTDNRFYLIPKSDVSRVVKVDPATATPLKVSDIETRYASFLSWLWKKARAWYDLKEDDISGLAKLIPIMLIAISLVGLPDDGNYIIGVHWAATLLVISLVLLGIQGLWYIFVKTRDIWRSYQEEVWE